MQLRYLITSDNFFWLLIPLSFLTVPQGLFNVMSSRFLLCFDSSMHLKPYLIWSDGLHTQIRYVATFMTSVNHLFIKCSLTVAIYLYVQYLLCVCVQLEVSVCSCSDSSDKAFNNKEPSYMSLCVSSITVAVHESRTRTEQDFFPVKGWCPEVNLMQVKFCQLIKILTLSDSQK